MSVTENCKGIKLSELERSIYDFVLSLARKILAGTLEGMSNDLQMQLDSSRYENKGMR